MCFFFQAEDGIRDLYVTGVQTCALPILMPMSTGASFNGVTAPLALNFHILRVPVPPSPPPKTITFLTGLYSAKLWYSPIRRSEERRVGKECTCWWGAEW